jgi:hypothetical protein
MKMLRAVAGRRNGSIGNSGLQLSDPSLHLIITYQP